MNDIVSEMEEFRHFLKENGAHRAFCSYLTTLNGKTFSDYVRHIICEENAQDDLISCSFYWTHTSMGVEYWDKLDYKWRTRNDVEEELNEE